MIRFLTLALLLTAGPVAADSPTVAIAGAKAAGAGSSICLAGGRVRFYVTFTDPDGLSYAAVELAADAVRPAVPDRARTWLWIPDYARDQRAYRWRFEDQAASRTRRTIPVVVDLAPGSGPLVVHLEAKDGAEELLIDEVALVPSICR